MSDKGKWGKLSEKFEVFIPGTSTRLELPLFNTSISAGFPSPADDFIDKKLDLNEYLIRNKPATFLLKVSGNSMVNAGIYDGDILVVDRSMDPADGRIVIGIIDGEFTVKRIIKKGGTFYLHAENDDFKPIEITEEMDFKIWGIVTFAIHKV